MDKPMQEAQRISVVPFERNMSIFASPTGRTSSAAGKGLSRVSLGRVVDDEMELHPPIKLINIIFLPFHPVFTKIIFAVVLIKCVMGPLQSVYPIQYCKHLEELHWILTYVKYVYASVDPIYAIDFFLHVIHRQVTDEAMKREHLPKSALCLFLDLFSLLPMYRLLAEDSCPKALLWPNILAFNEFFICYRVIEFLSLETTHSMRRLILGYVILSILVVNCLTCFTLLATYEGFCAECKGSVYYDWRAYVQYKFPDLHMGFNSYVLAATQAVCYLTNVLNGEVLPGTHSEYILLTVLMITGFITVMYIVMPKMFCEYLLRMRRVAHFHPRVTRIIQETQRRNPSRIAHISVEVFYSLSWKKSQGLTAIPGIINELPRYLKLDIIQDLSWPVFYHSPTFRNTSSSYKRWLCERIRLEYKFPGERFFSGKHCYTNLYYLKSGIIQLISSDDSTSPLLSVSGGTLFGDISFYLPPLRRKVMLRCFTFCEVFVISRIDILISLHKFPRDRVEIIKLALERIKHARTLFDCKQSIRGQNRPEDEGIAWIKSRWWQISHTISKWKKTSIEANRCELPGEETLYHCAKYIGQLVLCTTTQLTTNTMFSKVTFPWVLVPNSTFGKIWNRILIYTLYFVLLFYPPNLSRNEVPIWFKFFQFTVDVIFVIDILISLMTAMEKNDNISFVAVLLSRLKTFRFLVDILSTAWIENVIYVAGKPQIRQHCQFNRLLKTYLLFLPGGFRTKWQRNKNPLDNALLIILFTQFYTVYISAYFFFVLHKYVDGMKTNFLFDGEFVCQKNNKTCNQDDGGVFPILLGWIVQQQLSISFPITYEDLIFGHCFKLFGFIFMAWMKAKFIAALYLKYKYKISYHMFVANLKSHYMHYKIHPDLMKRLDRYLTCHWKYFFGTDVVQPNLLKDEPFDIYWRFHGAVAEKILSSSRAFEGADSALIKELASKTKFAILPTGTTLGLFGVVAKNATWIVNGTVKVEYHSDEGELIKAYVDFHRMIQISSVFFGKAAIRTYTAATDCEILYINLKDLFEIIRHYPLEQLYLNTCRNEFRQRFDDILLDYIKKHRAYQKKLRDAVFHARQSLAPLKVPDEPGKNKFVTLPEDDPSGTGKFYLDHPETLYIIYWSGFRAFIVIVKIWSTAIRNGGGAYYFKYFSMVDAFCDGIGIIDITLKFFMPHYNESGLVITDFRACMWHYLSRSFILDFCGSCPVLDVMQFVLHFDLPPGTFSNLNTLLENLLLYNVMGFFDYMLDKPTGYIVYLTLLKWQIILFTIVMSASSIFVSKCINFEYDDNENLVSMNGVPSCWLPGHASLLQNVTLDILHMTFVQSLNLAQCALFKSNTGGFIIRGHMTALIIMIIVLGTFFWCLLCFSKALLILNHRGTSVFQHAIDRLITFLQEERVPRDVITRAMNHYDYWWTRTQGMTSQNLMTEQMGVVFKQDLYFYFYKKTLAALDELLQGGEPFQRQMSNVIEITYFLNGAFITREMDLVPQLYIVHRGSVIITKNGKKIANISKGGIFGQLQGRRVRPIRITAQAREHTDLLMINLNDFQDILTDEIKAKIDKNTTSVNDYMNIKKYISESPFNTIQYILRGRKTIKLPGMQDPCDIQACKWYGRWLYFVWLFVTTISSILSLIVPILPRSTYLNALGILILLDLIYFANFVLEFYTMELVVYQGKCSYEYIRLKRLLKIGLYCDVISFLAPLVGSIMDIRACHMARLLRIHVFFDFHRFFCKDFQTKATPTLMKLVIMILLIHSLTCGWIYFACGKIDDIPHLMRGMSVPFPEELNRTINFKQWLLPQVRGEGCLRMTMSYREGNKNLRRFVVGNSWHIDYLIAVAYIVILITHTTIHITTPLTITQTYYKVFITVIAYMMEIYISSVTMSTVYTKLRELYQYDYNIRNLIKYLRCNGISKALIGSLLTYTKMLWRRQKGNRLPKLAQDAPLCLREDMFTALYVHHLEGLNIFNQLPQYFLRQLACRFRRMVIFPGKHIVETGDIYSTMFFIHEGEVERWYTDSNGDSRIVSVLTQNQTFGNIPGLYQNEPFPFTYFSRTVVDLVFLVYDDWKDLMEGYPDIKKDIYLHARALQRQIAMAKGLR